MKRISVALLVALMVASVGSGGSSCSYRRLNGLDGGGGSQGSAGGQDGGDSLVVADGAGLTDVADSPGDASPGDAACVPSSRGRDCSSPLDNDCDGRPDNTLDQMCTCVPGSLRDCDMHLGKDGVGACRAGIQTCMLGAPPNRSSYGGCSGGVGPTTDNCDADGADLDCDGIKGNGPRCTLNVYVYTTTGDVCDLLESAWPADIFMIAADDPAGPPHAGYTLIGQFKLFREGGGGKRPMRRCYIPAISHHPHTFASCTGDGVIDEGLLGYTSAINGGNGWVQLRDVGGRNGILGMLRADDPKCCPYNCLETQNFVLQ